MSANPDEPASCVVAPLSAMKNMPKPTYWPMFAGLSITMIAWGLITSWIVSAVGALVLTVAVIGWMKEVSS